MTATASRASRKLASGPSTWRNPNNLRRSRRLGRESRPTNGYNIFRWYRAGWGRYTQADPLTAAARLELFGSDDPLRLYGGNAAYTYVRSNPLTLVDRVGLVEGPPQNNVCNDVASARWCSRSRFSDS